MKYFKLHLDDSNDNDIVVHCKDKHGFELYDTCNGKWIENWNDNFTFYYNLDDGNRFTDYLANNLGWFLVSEKLKDLITRIEGRVQFLPVNIVEYNSNFKLENYKYFVANVLDVVDALNLENSDYFVIDLDGEKINSVSKYAVSRDKLNNKDLFKLKGDEIPLFVSERFKNLVEQEKITGCDFLEILVVE